MTFSLEARNLAYRYPGSERKILDGADLAVKRGEVLAIVGLSGCGKSTLCYCLCGIIPHIYQGYMEGDVLIDGVSASGMKLPEIVTKLGIVFQDPDTQLFSPTVEDEIAFGPENLCIERDEIGLRIESSISQVGMENHRLDSPNHLSGGQKQLVALASVLSLKPEILILDEAMAQIDAEGRKLIKKTIRSLKETGKTLVLVEHDMENLDIADRILVLKDGKLDAFKGSL
jgi:energy-coupling factor transport system ATP-binding protein